ncbi:hypothetical protein G4B88_028030 [Cannabis sativa]|uniref:Uncharacterized protein n=1 Tax=Cannabis sativa TaxID=3483 RepID=A0A7J6I8C1_CANSA|nr:hypothetical protein G4B88_028030 [Cannabis sativa]
MDTRVKFQSSSYLNPTISSYVLDGVPFIELSFESYEEVPDPWAQYYQLTYERQKCLEGICECQECLTSLMKSEIGLLEGEGHAHTDAHLSHLKQLYVDITGKLPHLSAFSCLSHLPPIEYILLYSFAISLSYSYLMQGALLRKHIDATLGSGNLREAVKLPTMEDLNEWLAVNNFFNQKVIASVCMNLAL